MSAEILNKWSRTIEGFPTGDVFTSNKRLSSFNLFQEFGIPNTKKEEWRYTPLNFLGANDFMPVLSSAFDANLKEYSELIKTLEFDEEAINLVFINGSYVDDLSHNSLEDTVGLFVGSLRVAKEKNLIADTYKNIRMVKADIPFSYLNEAFHIDGACLILPENFTSEKPFHLIHISDSNSGMLNPLNLIIAGEGASARIVESYHNHNSMPAFINSVTKLKAEENSTIDYFKFQNEDSDLYLINSTNIEQESKSTVNSYVITLNGKFIRNNLSAKLSGEYCESNLIGLYFLDGKNFVDNHTLVEHSAPNCNSNEIYKGILDGNSTAVFNGKIMVARDAQKTNAYQKNKNILLSDNCTINTKPQLEILADDVKCSHGATSGKIDEDALFYLKTRGISENKAKSLLLNAFASEITEKVNIPQLRDYVREQIAQRLNIEDIYLCHLIDEIK